MSDPRIFFDTNILLYLLSGDQTKADRAETLLAAGGVISVQVLNEFAAVASRKLKMPWSEIRDVLSTVRTVCTVEPITVETHDDGLAIAERHGFSVYDSLIISAAMRADCDILFSEDMQNGQVINHLTIRNPFLDN